MFSKESLYQFEKDLVKELDNTELDIGCILTFSKSTLKQKFNNKNIKK